MTINAAVGVLLPSRELTVQGASATELVEQATAAEAAGFDSVWLGDSAVARPRHEPLTVLAAVAACTEYIRLGTAVLVAALRQPVLLANTVATLDQLSRGRVLLGVGTGPSYGPARKEYATLGVPFDRRLARLREGVAICRALWRGGPVDFEGPSYRLGDVELGVTPVQAGGPPVWLGAKGARWRLVAGIDFDGWLPGAKSPEWFSEGLAQVRAAAAGVPGRDPARVTAAAYLSVRVSDAGRVAQAEMRSALERYYKQPYEVIAALHDTRVGPAEEAAQWLAGYVRAGAQHLVVRLMGPDQREQMVRLAAYLPAIRGAVRTPGS